MSSKFTLARAQMKDALEKYEPLEGVPVFIERDGVDIDDDVEAALESKGLAIIILATGGAVVDQANSGKAVVLRATVPVCILENVARNMADADENAELPEGLKMPSEDVLQNVIRCLLGREIGDGEATLAKDAFARGGDEAGLIENYVGFDVPIMFRAG